MLSHTDAHEYAAKDLEGLISEETDGTFLGCESGGVQFIIVYEILGGALAEDPGGHFPEERFADEASARSRAAQAFSCYVLFKYVCSERGGALVELAKGDSKIPTGATHRIRQQAKARYIDVVRRLGELRVQHVANVDGWVASRSLAHPFTRPDASHAETGAAATAKRLMPVAFEAVKLMPLSWLTYGSAIKTGVMAVKYGFFANELLGMLSPAFCTFVDRIVPVLQRHVSTSAKFRGTPIEAGELALRLYYLGCSRTLEYMRNPPVDATLPSPTARAGHAARAERADLELLGSWIGAADWLYAAYHLPTPMDNAEWSGWYAARLAARQGWRTLACIGAASTEHWVVPTFPARSPFPAWLLAVKEGAAKEAVLTLRGSMSPTDWSISFDCDEQPVSVDGVE